jgi:hypothetical protein
MGKHILLLVLFFQVTVAFSQDTLKTYPTNEYRYVGGGLACITDSLSADSPLACLHIGSIGIGDEYPAIEAKYGSVSQTIPQSEGREVRVFELKSKTNEITYLAITVKNSLVDAIQVAGATPDESLSFSSISIGDSPRRLIELLGKPSKSKLVEETGATLWSYAPFPFSFEITGERVYSIKIWNP